MTVDNERDLEKLRRIGAICRDVLIAMMRAAQPGMTSLELDRLGEGLLNAAGARSAPRLAYNFPGATCISVGSACAHGVPGDEVLKAGQLINVDVSAELGGYWADTGASFTIGPAGRDQAHLLKATRSALRKGIYAARAGQPVNAIGRQVEGEAARQGYRLVEGLHGHGVGGHIHEEPTIWNHYERSARERLHEGQVITIEPFLTRGVGRIFEDKDGWTLRTRDGVPAAQFEHTMVITRGAPILITA